MVWSIAAYLAVVNLIAFCAMGIDKKLACHGKRRIPEKTLFLFVLLGGGIGGYLGMIRFHHKVRKPAFAIGFRVIPIVQIVVAIWAFSSVG